MSGAEDALLPQTPPIAVNEPGQRPRGSLLRKYALLFIVLVGVALIANSALDFWFSYKENQAALVRVQQEKADAAAQRIEAFIEEIKSQIGWTTHAQWAAGSLDQRRFDYVRLLRQVPAITELSELDGEGKEQLRVSRLAMDAVGSGEDFSFAPAFTQAKAHGAWFSPVYFRKESEPYMTLAMARAGKNVGVTVAEINLKLIWDVVTALKIGQGGYAYVVDQHGRLIAHPDISLVLRDTNLSKLPQVTAALAPAPGTPATRPPVTVAKSIGDRSVLTAHATISPLGWLVFVEVPLEEAFAPLYGAAWRSGLVLVLGLLAATLVALVLARRMTGPIRALQAGAARIGAGELDRRIDIHTGDELEGLADQFNSMAADLHKSYAELERKVEERTAELSEALDQQTATSEVLQVINYSPGDLMPVFDAMLERAMRLCGAAFGELQTYDGERFQMAALRGLPPRYSEFRISRTHIYGPGTIPARLLAGERLIQVLDITVEDAYRDGEPNRLALADLGGARTVLAVPLLKDDALLGFIVVYRQEVRQFSDKQIALLENFAAQAVIAMENTRLITETQEALDQQTATAEVLEVINSSPGDLTPVFDAMLEKAMRLCGAAFGLMAVTDRGETRTVAARGLPPALAEFRRENPIVSAQNTLLARVLAGEPFVHTLDLKDDDLYRRGEPLRRANVDLGGARTSLYLPLKKDREVLGTLHIYRQEVRLFTDKQIALLENFAAQAVIAMENARLITETREARDDAETALRELKAAQANLIQAEKMASLGQLTAGIAHEIKNPLNFVNNFASLSVELLDELKETAAPAIATLDEDKRADVDDTMELLTGNLEKIAEHGKRADNIVKSMLEHSRGVSGERREVDLNQLVEEALNLAYHGARAQDQSFNITLERDYAKGLKPIELAPQEMTRVFLNLFGNGFYAATKRTRENGDGSYRPSLTVATRKDGDVVEVRVRDNGTGIPPEIKDKLFQPFFTTKPTGEGTGLGLSIAYDIVTQQHGGTITVESEPGVFTEFTIRLPRRPQAARTEAAA